jgi:hypothetical protein
MNIKDYRIISEIIMLLIVLHLAGGRDGGWVTIMISF